MFPKNIQINVTLDVCGLMERPSEGEQVQINYKSTREEEKLFSLIWLLVAFTCDGRTRLSSHPPAQRVTPVVLQEGWFTDVFVGRYTDTLHFFYQITLMGAPCHP